MLNHRPAPVVACSWVVIAALLIGCDARQDIQPAPAPSLDVPSTVLATASWSQPTEPVAASVVHASPPTLTPTPSTAISPSPAPSPSTAVPVPVQAALRVPLHYTPGSDWRVLVDSPNLLEIAYEPEWTASEDPPIWAVPRVAIGVPVGFDSISTVLKSFRSRPVEAGCPELSDPVPTAFGGLTGSGFACSGDVKGSRRLYRVASGNGASIRTSSQEVGDGWFLLTDGGYGSTTILFDVHCRPIIATIFGSQSHGPAQGGINRFADTLVLDLDLTFGAAA